MNNRIITNIVRILIVGFWLGIITFFLFVPEIWRSFKQEKSLTIFTWPLILDPQYLKKFEEETGIKLYISYYEGNQELFGKIRASKGMGYDIIMPSDYTIESLVKENLIKPLDRSKLNFFNALNPHLLGNYFDKDNTYSLPYFWGIYGLGINRSLFSSPIEPSWKYLFDSKVAPHYISMTDDPREAILMAAFYLYGNIEFAHDEEKIEAVTNLLIEQKSWVEAYSEARSEYLLTSQACAVALALSPDIYNAIPDAPELEFAIPMEGSFVFIDSIVISAATEKDDMIYQFINYLYRPEVLDHHRRKYGFCSPVYETTPLISEGFCPSAQQFEKLHFFRNVIPQSLVNKIWITVMNA